MAGLISLSCSTRITQRTLAAKSLRQGQLGILFAAALKLIIPFIIVFPGIIALQLYGDQLTTADAAYPILIRNLIPVGVRGLIFAAIAGAVISSLASMLNSASAIFTMDIYKRHYRPDVEPKQLVTMGRIVTLILVIIGSLIAPQLGNPRFQGIFNYIQEFQGFVSPGILAAFVFGMFFKRAPASAGTLALISSPIIYGLLFVLAGDIAFLNRMAITFGIILLSMYILTRMRPLDRPKEMPVREGFEVGPNDPLIVRFGAGIIAMTVLLYILFW